MLIYLNPFVEKNANGDLIDFCTSVVFFWALIAFVTQFPLFKYISMVFINLAENGHFKRFIGYYLIRTTVVVAIYILINFLCIIFLILLIPIYNVIIVLIAIINLIQMTYIVPLGFEYIVNGYGFKESLSNVNNVFATYRTRLFIANLTAQMYALVKIFAIIMIGELPIIILGLIVENMWFIMIASAPIIAILIKSFVKCSFEFYTIYILQYLNLKNKVGLEIF